MSSDIRGRHDDPAIVAPTYTTRVKGADYSASGYRVVGSVAEARAGIVAQSDVIYIINIGEFQWDATSTVTDDGRTAIQITGVTTGRYVRVGKTPNVYGNYAVARRLVDSLSSSKKATILHLGDSRSTTMSGIDQWCSAGWGIPWGGVAIPAGNLSGASWSSASIAATVATVAVATGDVYLGRFCPDSMNVTTFVDADPTAWASNRLTEVSYASATYVAMQPQVTGHSLTMRLMTRDCPSGVTNPSIRAYLREAAAGGPNTAYTDFSTYALTNTTTVHTTSVSSSWDWATYPTVTAGMIQNDAAHVPIANESVSWFQGIILESDIGVTHYNCSRGGAQCATYLNADVFADATWQSMIDICTGDKILWISLGTNDGGQGQTAINTLVTNLRLMITKWREFVPNGFVVLDTAYCTILDRAPTSRAVCYAAQIVAETDGYAMAVDTAAELGSYPAMVAAGYFGGSPDGVHFDDTGKLYYAQAFAGLVARAAAA